MQITFNAIMSAFLTTGAVKSLNDVYAISFFNICYVPVLSYILYPSNSLFFHPKNLLYVFLPLSVLGPNVFFIFFPTLCFVFFHFHFFITPDATPLTHVPISFSQNARNNVK
jgi:hypothetical protein